MDKKRILGHVITLITIIIWGTTFVSTKVLLTNLSPVEILFIRFLIGYIALLLVYPKFKKISHWKEELLFLASGVSGVTLYFLVENIALTYTLSSNVGILVSAAPILTAILAHLFIKEEKFNINLVYGFIIAITGIALVVFNGNFILKLNPLGDLLAVLAALIWAIYSILLKKVGNQYNHIYITRKIFFYGLLTILPLLKLYNADLSMHKIMVNGVLPNILFLGLAASALCFVMWNTAVGIIGAIKATSYIYLVPLITIISSVIILKERITRVGLLGAILILFGVYISEHGFNMSAFSKKANSLIRKPESKAIE